MQKSPLYFDLREVVKGRTFVVTVRMRGRITGVDEGDGSVWMYGVNPAGSAGPGEDLKSAYAGFRSALGTTLTDFADRAQDFAQFRDELEAFFLGTADDIVSEWSSARQEIRDGSVPELDWRRETADVEPELRFRSPGERDAPAAPADEEPAPVRLAS